MFKVFGKDKKSKKEKENSKPSSNLPPDLTPEEKKEAEKLPFGGNTRLSKSKSGRYKVKNKQRSALDDDVYTTAGSFTSTNSSASQNAAASKAGPSRTQGTSQQAGTSSSTSSSSYISGSNAQSSSSFGQQGSLGRSSGGHCGVANSVTKQRYTSTTAGISSQPTAV